MPSLTGMCSSTCPRSADRLGPLYTRDNCGACHTDGARGPGFVQKMSVVEADGITAAADHFEFDSA
jgi:hypothetical protein